MYKPASGALRVPGIPSAIIRAFVSKYASEFVKRPTKNIRTCEPRGSTGTSRRPDGILPLGLLFFRFRRRAEILRTFGRNWCQKTQDIGLDQP